MDLMELARTAEPPRTRKWADKYKTIYLTLIGKGFEPKQAADWIRDNDKLTKAEGIQLYNAAKQWKD
jgi:hypothetical protein